jgi:hypothetical protein
MGDDRCERAIEVERDQHVPEALARGLPGRDQFESVY